MYSQSGSYVVVRYSSSETSAVLAIGVGYRGQAYLKNVP